MNLTTIIIIVPLHYSIYFLIIIYLTVFFLISLAFFFLPFLLVTSGKLFFKTLFLLLIITHHVDVNIIGTEKQNEVISVNFDCIFPTCKYLCFADKGVIWKKFMLTFVSVIFFQFVLLLCAFKFINTLRYSIQFSYFITYFCSNSLSF